VGPDLARSTASIDRLRNTSASSDEAAEAKGDEAEAEAESAESGDNVDGQVLPVPA
jgi:single-strand DNA-binding protein